MVAALPWGLARAEAKLEQHLRSTPKAAAAVIGLTAAVLALRLGDSLAVAGVGGDYGHYLIAANWLAGNDRSGEGPFDPPFVPLLFLAFAPLVGKIAALQILGPLATAFLVPASFAFFERTVPRWAALVAAGLFALWQPFTELVAFGGVTNVFGIAFSLLFFRFFLQALSSPQPGLRPRRPELLAAVCLFLVLSSHHLSAFMTGATTVLWLAAALVRPAAPRAAVLATGGRVIGLAAAAGLIYLPYLLSLLPAEMASGLGTPVSPETFSSGVAGFWRYSPIVATGVLALAILGAARLRGRDSLTPALVAIAATPFLLLVTILYTHPFRPYYYVPFPLVAFAVLGLAPASNPRLRASLGPTFQPVARGVGAIVLAASLMLTAAATPALTHETRVYYNAYWTPGTAEALDWVAANTPPASVIAVDGNTVPEFNHNWQATSLGWMVEGYANRRAIYEGHPPLIPFTSKWPDVRAANRLFSGENVFEDGVLRVADSFPLDDWAAPGVSTGYFGDYHDFVGLAAPRLVDSANATVWWIISSADPSARPVIEGARGALGGSYAGPDFFGEREMAFDSTNHSVRLTTNLSIQEGAPWDSFAMTLLVPPWTAADVSGLSAGTVSLDVPFTHSYSPEAATLRFEGSNLSAAAARPGSSVQGSDGYELSWIATSRNFSLAATITFDGPPTSGPGPHPLLLRTARGIIADTGVTHLLVSTQSFATLRRVGLQPALYAQVFANGDYAIFRVLGPL
jgi:hypothetical protein